MGFVRWRKGNSENFNWRLEPKRVEPNVESINLSEPVCLFSSPLVEGEFTEVLLLGVECTTAELTEQDSNWNVVFHQSTCSAAHNRLSPVSRWSIFKIRFLLTFALHQARPIDALNAAVVIESSECKQPEQ